jgi:hypothetical protein
MQRVGFLPAALQAATCCIGPHRPHTLDGGQPVIRDTEARLI